MTQKLPVTATILTFNSATTVEKALQSVSDWCSEVLVVDGGSTDDTLAIAQQYGATVIDQGGNQSGTIQNFSAVRNHALAAASQPWILSLDSDEYLSHQLIGEIKLALGSSQPAAFWVPRKYVLDDERIVDYASTYPNERLYFFHQEVVQEWIKPVHERPELVPNTPVKRFQGASLAPLSSLDEYRQKNLRYLEIEKEKSAGKGWWHWLSTRLWHTLRSRLILTLRLLWIWLVPRKGTRLPLKHELLRYWYGWKLVWGTCPLKN